MNALDLVQAEAFQVLAQHYAAKIAATGIMPTQEEIMMMVEQNKEIIAKQIADLTINAAKLFVETK